MLINAARVHARTILLLLVVVFCSSTVVLYFNSEANRALLTERVRISSWTIFQAQIEFVKLSSLISRCQEISLCDSDDLVKRTELLASRIDILANSEEAAIIPYIPVYRPKLREFLEGLIEKIHLLDPTDGSISAMTGTLVVNQLDSELNEIDHLLQDLLRDAALYNNSVETMEAAIELASPTAPFVLLGLSGAGLVGLLLYQLRIREATLRRIESLTQDIRILVESLPVPVSVVSRSGALLFLNRCGQGNFGSFDSIPHTHLGHFFGVVDERSHNGIISLQVRDGQSRTFRYFRTDIQWSGVSSWAFIFQDTSLEADARLNAMSLGKRLLLGELSSSIVHELSQPLMTISAAVSNIEMMMTGANSPTSSIIDKLEKIKNQIARVSRIVVNVRKLSLPIQTDEEFNVRRVVESAVEMTAFQYEQSAILLRLRDESTVECRVRGNSVLLEITIVNLLLNCRDAYMSTAVDPDIDKVVDVVIYRNAGNVVIEVCDQAGGVDNSLIDNIFDSFVSSKLKEGGMGVGLSISRRAVEGMRGTIKAENRGGGACFAITLPLVEA